MKRDSRTPIVRIAESIYLSVSHIVHFADLINTRLVPSAKKKHS